MMKRVKLTQP